MLTPNGCAWARLLPAAAADAIYDDLTNVDELGRGPLARTAPAVMAWKTPGRAGCGGVSGAWPSACGSTADPVAAARAMLGLVRPIRIDNLAVHAPG